ncbi:MAG: hypothetical protein CM15mP109_08450 [Candidatus Dadabacteria bacterium]|nr:MAG: hypothetical protein CM15mP109_08450 [Candidatus Dadabacteria bacterium]
MKPYPQLRITQNINNQIDPIIFPSLPDSTDDFPLQKKLRDRGINGDGLDIYIGRMKTRWGRIIAK